MPSRSSTLTGDGAAVSAPQGCAIRSVEADSPAAKAGLQANDIVTAVNGTTSKVKANSSVTKSNIGVGVGVAVNIVSLNNIARLSDGEIEAAALTVSATTKETKPDSNTTVKGKDDKKVENKDGLAKQLGEMVTEYMYDLADEIGLGNYVSKDLLDKILTPLVTDTVTTLITATGLDTLFGSGDLKSKYETAKGLLLDDKKGLIALPQKLLQPVLSAMEEARKAWKKTSSSIMSSNPSMSLKTT